MADIFISYAREDRERAHEIADALGERGWSVWWDPQMLGGSQYPDVIERELGAARCVVLVWSASAARSRWVKNEARHAAERGVLIPVFIDETQLPIAFNDLHAINLSDWSAGTAAPEMESLLRSVAALVTPSGGSRIAAAPSVAVAGSRRFPRSGYIGIAAFVIALIVIAAITLKPKRSPDVVSVPTDTVKTSDPAHTTQPPPATDTTVTRNPPVTDTDRPSDRLPYGARAVGILMSEGRARCTAFLISADVAVTAAHCVKDKPRPLVIRLGYIDEDASPRDYAVERVLVQNESEAVLRLSGTPGRTFTPLSYRSRVARVGDDATLLHHDDGKALRVSKCKMVAVRTDELQYRCTTRAGASGGPLLAANGALLGFHYGSVSRADPDLKHGVPTSVFIGSIRPYWAFTVKAE